MRALAPLRHPAFRLLAAGQLASNLGDAFFAVALPWYVLSRHGGVLLLGAVMTAYGIPRTMAVAVGGHAADRWTPWSVMMVADATRAIAAAGLAGFAALAPAHAAFLIPVAIVLGASEGLFLPGSIAIVPALLPDRDLQAGNSLTAGGMQFATFVGPAIGGGVVAVVGSAPAFGVDAMTFVVSALTLSLVQSHLARRPAAIRAPVATAPSLRALLTSERLLQVILITTVAANLGSGGIAEVALPALAHGPLRAGATGYGALVAAFGGGALLGTILAAGAQRLRRPVLFATLAELIAAAFMAIIPYLGAAVPAAGALVIFGTLTGLANVIIITAFQRWAPPILMGRLLGLMMLSSYGIFPVSVLLGGIIVHALGPAPFFPLAASMLVIADLAALSQPVWRNLGATEPDTARARR